MTHPTELEIKLQVDPARQAGVMKALRLTRVAAVPHRARHFDTPDGRLAAHGLSLRLRQEGGTWVQTVKAADDYPLRRLEDNVKVDAPERSSPTVDLDRHASPALQEALAHALERREGQAWPPLVARFDVNVRRRQRRVEVEGEQFDVAFDEGTVEAGGRTQAVCEVEIEWKGGPGTNHLFALAERLVHDHHLWLSTASKASRGEALARPDAPAPVAKADEVRFGRHDAADRQLRAMVTDCLTQILPNASHVAAGSEHAEQIHQLRVGLRRLRTVLREAGGLAGDVDPAWEAPIAQAFRQLGVHRDQASMAETMRPRLTQAGAPEIGAWPPSVQADVAPGAAVRAPAFQGALLAVLAFSLRTAPAPTTGSALSSRRWIAQRLARLHRKVVAASAGFASLSPDEQHRVRKRLKRLRYLSELALPLFKRGEVERYLKHLRPAQDALGEHNDDAVALEGWRRHPPTEPGGWFAVGWLTARQAQTAKACQKALKKAAKAPPFWR